MTTTMIEGWGTRMRRRAGYRTPEEVYRDTLEELLTPGCRWLDVGCGRSAFPGDPSWSAPLAARCSAVVGADPDAAVAENPDLTDRFRGTAEAFAASWAGEPFDVATARMVAEHVEDPAGFCGALASVVRPGGLAAILTVPRWAPASIAASMLPGPVRHGLKRLLFRSEPEDTFPVRYRMNSRARLRAAFGAAGFAEERFERIDDCRTLARWPAGLRLELALRRGFRACGLPYPEACLLGVYRREGPAHRARAQ